jgi:hypothetical protein
MSSVKKRAISTMNSLTEGEIYLVQFENKKSKSKIKRIVLKLKFNYSIPYSSIKDNDDYEELMENIPTDNSDFEEEFYPLLWFHVNSPRQEYESIGLFTVVSVEELYNVQENGEYTQIPFLKDNTLSDNAFNQGINIKKQPKPTIKDYIKTNSNIWIGIGLNGLTEENLIVQNTTEDDSAFISMFPDYLPFMEFVTGKICGDLKDVFCNHYLGLLSPSDFTEKAPTPEMSFYSVPEEHLASSTPFLSAMKYIYTKINAYQPSIEQIEAKRSTEYSYFIKLNRLIYYYNVFNLLNNNTLQGFENTAAVLIYTHGDYDAPDDITPIEPPLENIFLYSKAPVGFESFDTCTNIFTDVMDGEFMDQMYESINNNNFITFDNIVFKRNERCKYGPRSFANCFIEQSEVGKARQHYIFPNTKVYLNKVLSSKSDGTDNRVYIIDLEELRRSKEEGLPIEAQLRRANLLEKPELLDMMDYGFIFKDEENENKVLDYRLKMSAIINYYSRVAGKQNLFIYDMSCGVTKDPRNMQEVIKKITESGLGKNRKKRKTRKQSKKRMNKKTKRRI